MTDTIGHWLTLLGQFFRDWPALSAILIAVGLSWAPGVAWDQWFAPDSWPAKKVKRVSLIITFIVAAVVASVCWRTFVPNAGRNFVVVLSIAASFSAPFVHMVVGTVLDKYISWMNLAGKLKKAE